jgi:hypothetical protein
VKKLNVKVIALAVGLAFSAGAMAQSMSKDDYKLSKDRIAVEYKTAKTGCASLSGNSNDICMAEADGSQNVARAELEAGYKPTSKTRHAARIAKADANYAVAKERCDDMAGNSKDVCVKRAMAADTAAGPTPGADANRGCERHGQRNPLLRTARPTTLPTPQDAAAVARRPV